MEPDVTDVLRQHFLALLMPRNHGIIIVSQVPISPPKYPVLKSGCPGAIVASLGNTPFLFVELNSTAIVLRAKYPFELKSAMPGRLVVPPKSPKPRRVLAEKVAQNPSRTDTWSISIDLCTPDAVTRAEFFANYIITTMKSIVTKYGDRIVLRDPNHEFKDLFVLATIAYNKKVLFPKRRKGHG